MNADAMLPGTVYKP